MPIETLTYAALGARLTISPKAARSLAKRLRLPRSLSDAGKALVSVDLAEIRHTPRLPSRREAGSVALAANIVALQVENARLEAADDVRRAIRRAIVHHEDFDGVHGHVLCEDTGDSALDEALVIVRVDENGDGRFGHGRDHSRT